VFTIPSSEERRAQERIRGVSEFSACLVECVELRPVTLEFSALTLLPRTGLAIKHGRALR
jgi:hypothetical protein